MAKEIAKFLTNNVVLDKTKSNIKTLAGAEI